MTREEMESRRMLAVRYFELGMRQSYVWRKLGVSSMAVSRWHQAWRAGKSLKARKNPGRPCRMTAWQIERLRYLCINERMCVLNTAELSAFIQEYFGISYDRDHVGRLMRRLGIWGKNQKVRKAVV